MGPPAGCNCLKFYQAADAGFIPNGCSKKTPAPEALIGCRQQPDLCTGLTAFSRRLMSHNTFNQSIAVVERLKIERRLTGEFILQPAAPPSLFGSIILTGRILATVRQTSTKSSEKILPDNQTGTDTGFIFDPL
jgi:hypothetical protein